MRVLHINAGNLYGGVETVLVTLATHRNLCPQMESHFAVCFNGRLTQELQIAGAPVRDLGQVRVRHPLTVLRSRRALRDLLKREPFDLAICHSAWSQAIFGPVVRAVRLPLVFWLHDAVDGRPWLERWAGRTLPDMALCNSRFTAGLLPRLYPQVLSEVIYCPVPSIAAHYSEADRFRVRTELNTPQDATVIIQVSRFEAYKGHDLLLWTLSQADDLSQWIYWQVGGVQRPQDKQYLDYLKETATRLGIADRVRFLGQRSDVPKLLAASDIYCQPNTGPEPFGISFIEALFARLPVITTAIGGAKEIIDDSCGILVSPDNASELQLSLRQLIGDHALRVKLGKAGPARATKLCDVSTQLKRLYAVLFRHLQNSTRQNEVFAPICEV